MFLNILHLPQLMAGSKNLKKKTIFVLSFFSFVSFETKRFELHNTCIKLKTYKVLVLFVCSIARMNSIF